MSELVATALIAEDEPLLAQTLQAELQKAWPALQVVGCVGDGNSAVRQALALRPDVLFFDIRMPGQSGLDAATELVEVWPAQVKFPALVFVSAYDQYAVQAFEAQAVDYLLKPVQSERLCKTIRKLQLSLAAPAQAAINFEATMAQLRGLLERGVGAQAGVSPHAEPLRTLQVGVGTAIHLVAVDDVVYFEAADKYVRVLSAEREYLVRTPLKDLLPRLDPERFWQVHRGTVVQSAQITRVLRDEAGKLHLCLRSRAEKLPVSRLYAHRFKSM